MIKYTYIDALCIENSSIKPFTLREIIIVNTRKTIDDVVIIIIDHMVKTEEIVLVMTAVETIDIMTEVIMNMDMMAIDTVLKNWSPISMWY